MTTRSLCTRACVRESVRVNDTIITIKTRARAPLTAVRPLVLRRGEQVASRIKLHRLSLFVFLPILLPPPPLVVCIIIKKLQPASLPLARSHAEFYAAISRRELMTLRHRAQSLYGSIISLRRRYVPLLEFLAANPLKERPSPRARIIRPRAGVSERKTGSRVFRWHSTRTRSRCLAIPQRQIVHGNNHKAD